MTDVLNINLQQFVDETIETSPLIRGLDLVVAGACLILLAPLFLILGLSVKFTSPGPVLHKRKRVGKGGQIFELCKFRTMLVSNYSTDTGMTAEKDLYVTKLGEFLRRTKLDELPQLINVFRGQMSLVGPRPKGPRIVARYSPEQLKVLAVRPGITGPASLHCRVVQARTSEKNWETVYREQVFPYWLSLDLNYLRKRTIWSDLALILKTILVVSFDKDRPKAILRLRNRHFFVLDILALLVTPMLALTLRLERLDWWPEMGPRLVLFTLVVILVTIPIFYNLGLYRRFWRYAGVNDLSQVALAVSLSTTVITILVVSVHAILEQYNLAMYRTVPLIEGFLIFLTVGGFRFGLRGLHSWNRQRHEVVNGRRTLIVGAGEAGAMVAREMRANPQLDMEPVAFADDDPNKLNVQIQGLPVTGTIADITKLVDRYQIQRIVVTIPSAPLGRYHEIVELCKQTGITTHILPGVYEILAGYKSVSRIPRFEINQLLGREPIETNQMEVAELLANEVVLVTGAGGSIGSELCRQVARCHPKEIILLGHGENSIFEIALDLRLSFPGLVTHAVIVDVRDQERIDQVVQKYRPNVIFHAAAHKHVPFMEAHVEEAITNNVIGTWNVLRAAEQYDVERFVFISTDKAVNPTSIMGATKRIAELLVIAVAQRSGKTYMTVRFGNVLGSRGSVLHVFQQQLAAGGPLTLTHPDMYRYFMTIPEAVQLVLQAAVLGQGCEAFVLDMGQPIRILDMATDLVKLSGLELGRDIDLIYTGIRPGEKLNEELFLEGEDYQRTKHAKIFSATHKDTIGIEDLEQIVFELANLTKRMQSRNGTGHMLDLLPQICYYIDHYQSRSQLSWSNPTLTPKQTIAA